MIYALKIRGQHFNTPLPTYYTIYKGISKLKTPCFLTLTRGQDFVFLTVCGTCQLCVNYTYICLKSGIGVRTSEFVSYNTHCATRFFYCIISAICFRGGHFFSLRWAHNPKTPLPSLPTSELPTLSDATALFACRLVITIYSHFPQQNSHNFYPLSEASHLRLFVTASHIQTHKMLQNALREA